MVSYRGIEKKDILQSLQQAEAFVRRQDMGPATTSLLDNWLAQDPFAKIAAAPDNAALAQVIDDVRAIVFVWVDDVIKYQAKKDLAQSGGEALDVYKGLTAWDGFYEGDIRINDLLVPGIDQDKDSFKWSRAFKKQHELLHDERTAYLLVQYAKELNDKDVAPDSLFMQRFVNAVESHKKYMTLKDTLPAKLISFMPELVETLKTKGDLAARDLILGVQLWGFMTSLPDVLKEALPINKSTTTLDSVTRFNDYGVKTGGYMYNDEIREILAPSMPVIDAALKPFEDQGLIVDRSIGVITGEPDFDAYTSSYGLRIRTTRDAAQALATACPAAEIIDHTATRISPAVKDQRPMTKHTLKP